MESKTKNHLIILILIILLNILYLFIIQKNNEPFSICGKKNLNRKDIWINVKKKYGEKNALSIFPKTYILPNEIMDIYNDNDTDNKQYILKKLWSKARKGVELYNNKNKIYRDYKNFDIAQVYIKNPLLVNGFKFDIRLFMVSFCGLGIFLYVNGYNVYTEKKFNYNSLDRKTKINQAYGDDKHYIINNLPRTTTDLQNYLNIKLNPIMKYLSYKLNKILSATNNLCCNNDNGTYNIYGLDIELLDNYDPIVIEINSEPTLKFDDKWKKNLIYKMKEDINNKNFNNNNWIKIIG